MQPQGNPDDFLARLVATAVEYGADALDIEYKDGHEEVCAMKGNVGFGIASLDSSSEEAQALREHLGAIGRKGKTITAAGVSYRLKVRTHDSFGEEAFRVSIEKSV